MALGIGLNLARRRSAFSPLSRADLDVWYSSQQGVFQDTARTTAASANNDPVRGWQDYGPNGWHASENAIQPKLELNAYNGKPGVRFSGAQRMLASGYTTAGGRATYTWFVVYQPTVPDGDYGVLTGPNDQPFIYQATNQAWACEGLSNRGRAAQARTQAQLLTVIYDGSQTGNANRLKVRLNGVAQSPTYEGTIPASLSAGTGLRFGQFSNGGSFFNGSHFEAIGFASALSDAECQQVEAFIAARVFANRNSAINLHGDSLTHGSTDSFLRGMDYGTQLQAMLGASLWDKLNAAAPGNTIAQVSANVVTTIDRRRDVWRPQDWFLCWCGTNDLYAGTSGATAYAAYKTLLLARRAQGFKVPGFPIIPRADTGVAAGFMTQMAIFNGLLYADAALYDGIIPLDQDARLANPNNTTYFLPDKAHLNDNGYTIPAQLAYAVIQAHS